MATQVKRLKMEHDGVTVINLNWDHPVQLVGEKVEDRDLLNCCMLCCLPILIYGRMIPCKHVLCLDCAKKHSSSICSKCGEKVTRIEQNPLGTVFVCSYGSSRHGPGGCKRTYLSYRDMEAHVKHRHKKKEAAPAAPVQSRAPAQMIPLGQPLPNLAQPPHQYMGPPTHLPPHSHMINHPPPLPTTNVPPPVIAVSLQQGHVHALQPNVVSLQGSLATMQPNPHARPGPMPLMQPAPQAAHPQQRHVIPGSAHPGHHPMIATVPPPTHGMPTHQTLQGSQPLPMRHVIPQQPPVVQSKSHGNLISIPIQGSTNWIGQGQQQWPNQVPNAQQQHHRQGQYNQ